MSNLEIHNGNTLYLHYALLRLYWRSAILDTFRSRSNHSDDWFARQKSNVGIWWYKISVNSQSCQKIIWIYLKLISILSINTNSFEIPPCGSLRFEWQYVSFGSHYGLVLCDKRLLLRPLKFMTKIYGKIWCHFTIIRWRKRGLYFRGPCYIHDYK